MADKVICPYCGAGMVQGNGFDAISFVCEDCGSKGPAVFQGINESDWEAWTRAKKATICRADPPNRVLTRAEFDALPCDSETGGDPVYIECRHKNDFWGLPVYIGERCDEFLKTWRPWLRKPTEEERKAVKWQ